MHVANGRENAEEDNCETGLGEMLDSIFKKVEKFFFLIPWFFATLGLLCLYILFSSLGRF